MLKKINEILSGTAATLIGGLCLAFHFFLPRMGIHLPADPAWITVVICGIPLVSLAIRRLICNPGISRISSALLISIAMSAAIFIGDLFAAGEVAFIMALGAILEEKTTDRAQKGLKKLIGLAPVQGRLLTDGTEKMVPAETIQPGDILRIFPGEVIPADGVILHGETSVDQSIMTGESLPVDKAEKDEVFCGTLNCFGSIDIRAVHAGQNSTLQKLIRMVQEAEEKKAPMARIADRCASILVPAALLIAIAAGLVTRDIVRAVTVLVVFCPCALVLATPTAVMAAIGQAAKHGVVIKSGEALENMGKADAIAFDKTGTLTYGKLKVCDVISFDPKRTEQELLSLAASAEARSEHPLGRAITACAKEKNAVILESSAFSMSAGKGVRADVAGHTLLCGAETWMAEHQTEIPSEAAEQSAALRRMGKASILVAEDRVCIGLIALSDVLREGAVSMTAKLSAMNVRTLLLTGDHQKTAEYFADRAGIRTVHAGLLPEEKVAQIQKLRTEGRTVCMIGDGVNDAPALKTASVGVAMGSMGSDIAVEAADIALMTDDLSRIPYLKRLSNATVRTIRCSITLSMCINFCAVTLSVLGVLTPTTGALVHNAGSCFVVLIAALLYDRKFED